MFPPVKGDPRWITRGDQLKVGAVLGHISSYTYKAHITGEKGSDIIYMSCSIYGNAFVDIECSRDVIVSQHSYYIIHEKLEELKPEPIEPTWKWMKL